MTTPPLQTPTPPAFITTRWKLACKRGNKKQDRETEPGQKQGKSWTPRRVPGTRRTFAKCNFSTGNKNCRREVGTRAWGGREGGCVRHPTIKYSILQKWKPGQHIHLMFFLLYFAIFLTELEKQLSDKCLNFNVTYKHFMHRSETIPHVRESERGR